MNADETTVINDLAAVDPSSVAAKAAVATVETIANPSPESIVNDLMLAVELVKEFKAKIAGLHPSISNIIKALL